MRAQSRPQPGAWSAEGGQNDGEGAAATCRRSFGLPGAVLCRLLEAESPRPRCPLATSVAMLAGRFLNEACTTGNGVRGQAW